MTKWSYEGKPRCAYCGLRVWVIETANGMFYCTRDRKFFGKPSGSMSEKGQRLWRLIRNESAETL